MRKFRVVLVCTLLAQTAFAQPVKWPEGPGQKLVQKACLICHSGELIVGQRLSPDVWAKEVEKMAGWGAPIPDEEKKALADYLSEHFSPTTPLPKPLVERFSF